MKATTDTEWELMEGDGFTHLVGPFYEWKGGGDNGRFRFFAEDKHRNRNGFVQGGMLVTFADRAMGAFARRHDSKRVHVTAQLDVQFIHSAKLGAAVDIETRIIREGRNLVFVQGTITSEARIVAMVSGIWSILARGD